MKDTDSISVVSTSKRHYQVVGEVPAYKIEKVKKQIGLETSDRVRAVYLKDLDSPGIYLKENERNPWHLIVLPSNEKSATSSYIKHELTHLKLQPGGMSEDYRTPSGYTRDELSVAFSSKGGYKSIDIASMLTTLQSQFGLTAKESRHIVKGVALKLGYPNYIIRRGFGMEEQYRAFTEWDRE